MTLPSYDEALAKTLALVQPPSGCENVSLEQATGRVLAENIVADRDLPPYNRSQMDGYAVVANEVHMGASMEVTDRIAAGSIVHVQRKPNTCVAIATGAPLPKQFDAVVQHEHTDCGDLAGGKVTFHVDEVEGGKAIHKQGVDANKGEVLIHGGTHLYPQHIGIAATVGKTELAVMTKPKVIILTSGDEVVSPSCAPESHQIRNGNGPMITSLFTAIGCDVRAHQHLQDDLGATTIAVVESLQTCDLLITVGGISAGERDFFPQALDEANVEYAVQGVSMQPGKPVIVGKNENAFVLGLPGNPVSALACAHLFGVPIVSKLLGTDPTLRWMRLPLATTVIPNKLRTAFRPCTIVNGKVEIPSWQGSGDLVHTSQTVGLAQLPMVDRKLHAGELVSFLSFVR